MLKVNNYSVQSYNANRQNNNSNAQSFKGIPSGVKTVFNWVKDQTNIDRNGSLTRAMFIAVAGLFMLGGRVIESRDKDERREVITRDVPAVLISVLGAPFLSKGLAYAVTKKTGVPILKLPEQGTKHRVFNSSFSTQKQITDWYSDLGKNAVENFTKTIDENGGSIVKAFKKANLTEKLSKITDAVDNKGIREALKTAKEQNTEAFQNLETAVKGLGKDNSLLKFAKNAQAGVKLVGIAITAGILGYLLPRINIVVTRNKYKKKLDEGQINQSEFDKRMMRTSPVFRVSNGVLSFHKTSAEKTFKTLLSMVENPEEISK